MRGFLRRALAAVLCCLMWLPASAETAAPEDTEPPVPEVSAASGILVHAESGTVLWEKDAHTPMLIASTTKLMTALVVLEHCNLDETVEILWDDVQVEGSAMYLRPGETYTVEELLYGLLLASGNDAALALARHTAGSVEDFAVLMNETARKLDMTESRFQNPHGLDAENHHASAGDLAKLMCAAMENPDFARICGTHAETVHGVTYVNHNKLLTTCDGVVAGKTGYTIAAGRSLVTCCEREGMRLVCVTLSAPDDWNDHAALYDWAYGVYTDDPAPFAAYRLEIPVLSGAAEAVEAAPREYPRLLREKSAELCLQAQAPRFVYAPVEAGSYAGTVTLLADGTALGDAELEFRDTVDLDPALAAWRFLPAAGMSQRLLLA